MPLITYQGPIITVDTRSNANNTEHPVIGQPVVSSTAATRVLAEIELGSAPRPADPVDTGNANNTVTPVVGQPVVFGTVVDLQRHPRTDAYNLKFLAAIILTLGSEVGLIWTQCSTSLSEAQQKLRIIVCRDDCVWEKDGVCDDGGLGSEFASCFPGTDCSDCTSLPTPPPSPPEPTPAFPSPLPQDNLT